MLSTVGPKNDNILPPLGGPGNALAKVQQPAELTAAVTDLFRIYNRAENLPVNLVQVANLIVGESTTPANTAALNRIIADVNRTDPALARAITRLRNAVNANPTPLTTNDLYRIYREGQRANRRQAAQP